MSLAVPMDSELRAVLQEVAEKSPGRGLFAGLSPTRIRGAFQLPDQRVSVATAGLSSAERQLIRVHREELAWVLEATFIANLHADKVAMAKISSMADVRSFERLERDARRLRAEADPQAFRYRTGHYLGRIADGDRVRSRVDLASLLVAALRLSDRWTSRYYYSVCSFVHDDHVDAARTLGPLLDPANPVPAAYANTMKRNFLRGMGKHASAFEAGMLAVSLASKAGLGELAAYEGATGFIESALRGWPTPVQRFEGHVDLTQVAGIARGMLAAWERSGSLSNGQCDLALQALEELS